MIYSLLARYGLHLFAALCVAAALAGLYFKGRADGAAPYRLLEAQRAQAVADDLREQDRLRRQQAQSIQGVVDRGQIESQRLAAALAAARTELDGLRADAAVRASAPAPAGCTGERNYANTAEQLLGECAARYQAVAGEADRFSQAARERGEVIEVLINRPAGAP